MRTRFLLLIVLLAALIAGCAGQTPTPTPTPSPTPLPDPTDTAAPTTEAPASATATPSGPATCELAPLEFAPEPSIPDVTDDDHIKGPEEASITFIEYADFQCPGCAAMTSIHEYLADVYGDDIRFVYRHLPLTTIHDKAVITAEAAEAAAAQDSFWDMHDLLYERQEEWSQLPEDEMIDQLVTYAEELDLDTDQFRQDLEDHVYRDEIMAEFEAYQEYGVMATPTFVVNKTFYPQMGLHPYAIQAFVDLVTDPLDQYEEVPPQVIDLDNDYMATFETAAGDVVFELFAEQAPVNVNSFVFLAQDGWYDGMDFFLVQPDSAAHSGDPTGTGAALLGLSLPFAGYICGSEIDEGLSFDEPGMLGLFAPAPDANTGQFFVTYAPMPDLTGQLTVIGQVVEGMENLENLAARQPGPDQPEADTITTITIEEN